MIFEADLESISAKKLLYFSEIIFDFDIDLYFIGKKRCDFPFADYFSIYIPSAFYPTLIFQKFTLQLTYLRCFSVFQRDFYNVYNFFRGISPFLYKQFFLFVQLFLIFEYLQLFMDFEKIRF